MSPSSAVYNHIFGCIWTVTSNWFEWNDRIDWFYMEGSISQGNKFNSRFVWKSFKRRLSFNNLIIINHLNSYDNSLATCRKRIVTFKGTNGRQKTCEIFHVYWIFYSGFMCQTTVIFEITKDESLVLNTSASWNCFTWSNLFQNGANDMSECLTCETAFCKKKKKLKILYSSDHPTLTKLVVNMAIKELQMVFLTSTVINSNGNMREFERKIKCEKLMFR